jgi:integrase
MGIYTRQDSPFYWKKYDTDPTTKRAPRPPASTRIPWDAPSKALRDANKRDAELQYAQDLLDIRANKQALPAILFADYATTVYLPTTVHLRGNEGSTIKSLIKDFGHWLLTEITIDVVRAWRVTKVATHEASTVNLYASVLSKLLTRAVPTYLESNPLAAFKHGTQRKQLERLDEREFEARAFSNDEFLSFVRAIDSQDAICGVPKAEGLALAYAAVETLVRRGSLLTLTWADDRGTQFITKNTKVSRGKSKAPKAKPITPHLRVCLDDLPRDTPDRLIFASFHTTPAGYKQHAQLWFRTVCQIAKLPYGRATHGLTFHSFRHTGATWYLKAGYSVKAVMQLGGWTNAQLFLDTYVHVSDDEVAKMVTAMSNTLHPRRLSLVATNQEPPSHG